MSSIDNEIMLGAEEDAREVAFIRSYIGSELSDKLSDDDIYYVLDVISDYFENEFKGEPDSEGFVDVDVDNIVKSIAKHAKKEGMGPYESDDLSLLVNAELEYNEQLDD